MYIYIYIFISYILLDIHQDLPVSHFVIKNKVGDLNEGGGRGIGVLEVTVAYKCVK